MGSMFLSGKSHIALVMASLLVHHCYDLKDIILFVSSAYFIAYKYHHVAYPCFICLYHLPLYHFYL
jgi:hypothetical protein